MEQTENKPKRGRPFGSTQEVTFQQITLRVVWDEYEYFKSWNDNTAKALRELIKQANIKHKQVLARQKKEH